MLQCSLATAKFSYIDSSSVRARSQARSHQHQRNSQKSGQPCILRRSKDSWLDFVTRSPCANPTLAVYWRALLPSVSSPAPPLGIGIDVRRGCDPSLGSGLWDSRGTLAAAQAKVCLLYITYDNWRSLDCTLVAPRSSASFGRCFLARAERRRQGRRYHSHGMVRSGGSDSSSRSASNLQLGCIHSTRPGSFSSGIFYKLR